MVLTTKHTLPWSLALFLAIMISTVSLPGRTRAQEIGLIQGIQTFNGSFTTVIGLAWQKSPRVSAFVTGNVSPETNTIGVDGVIWFPLARSLASGLIVGPEVESSSPEPSPEELITYISAASGIALKFDASQKISIWTTARYYLIDHNLDKWRFSLMVVVFP